MRACIVVHARTNALKPPPLAPAKVIHKEVNILTDIVVFIYIAGGLGGPPRGVRYEVIHGKSTVNED